MTSPNLNYLMLLGAATEMSSILFSDVLADVTKAYYLFCPVSTCLVIMLFICTIDKWY